MLRLCRRMNGRHEALGDGEVVIDHLCDGSQTICCTASTRKDAQTSVQLILVRVDFVHEGWGIGTWSGDEDFSRFAMRCVDRCQIDGLKFAGAFCDVVDARGSPVELVQVAFRVKDDLSAIDDQIPIWQWL